MYLCSEMFGTLSSFTYRGMDEGIYSLLGVVSAVGVP